MKFSTHSFINAVTVAAVLGGMTIEAAQASSWFSTDQTTPAPPAPVQLALNKSYRDGVYTGMETDAYYGPMQVQAIVQGGRMVNVKVLQYPADRSTSRRINARALPWLRQEVIRAQSARVNMVTGATLSSRAFLRSLNDALAQAK